MRNVSLIWLGLAKNAFQVHGAQEDGIPVFNRELCRSEVMKFFQDQPACLVGMATCGSSRYRAHEIAKLGHDVRGIPPTYVKAFVKRDKTDAADAEAVIRKTMRLVPIKLADQHAATMVLKALALLVRQRTNKRSMPCALTLRSWGSSSMEALIGIIRDDGYARLPDPARLACYILDEQGVSQDRGIRPSFEACIFWTVAT